jgi:uncharacterized protein (TIGR00725 family)
MNKTQFEPGYDRRRKIVGVMGGKIDFPELTLPLGRLIARLGYHLLTGAGTGVMEGVSRAFFESENRQGLVLGVVRSTVPCDDVAGEHREYIPNMVNPWVEIPIYTHLHLSSTSCLSRNHINVLSSDIIIGLPGKEGTASEIALAMQYGTPVIIFVGNEKITGLQIENLREKLVIAEVIGDVESALNILLK